MTQEEIIQKIIEKTKDNNIVWRRGHIVANNMPWYTCSFVDDDVIKIVPSTKLIQDINFRYKNVITYRLEFSKSDGFIYETIEDSYESSINNKLSELYKAIEGKEFRFEDKINLFLK